MSYINDAPSGLGSRRGVRTIPSAPAHATTHRPRNLHYVQYLRSYLGDEGAAKVVGIDNLQAALADLGKIKLSGNAKRLVANIKGGAKVAGGAVGVKHGLTPSQLKKAGLVRKIGIIAGGVLAAVVVGPAVIAGAAKIAGFGVGKMSSVLAAANKVRAAAGYPPLSPSDLAAKLKRRRKEREDAGLPPETDEQAAQAIATDVATAKTSDLVSTAEAQRQIATAKLTGALSDDDAQELTDATEATTVQVPVQPSGFALPPKPVLIGGAIVLGSLALLHTMGRKHG